MDDFEEDFLFLEFMQWQEHLEGASVSSCFFSEVVTSPLMSQIYSAFRDWWFENIVSRGAFLFPPQEISCKISVCKPDGLWLKQRWTALPT